MVRGNRSGRIVVVNDRVDLPVTQAKTLAASTGKAASELCGGGAQGPGLLGCWTGAFPGSAADRSVFPVRIPQHAWERVNTLIAGHVNDVRGWTVPLPGESDLLAGGPDLCIVEAAGCAAAPGGQRFRDCSDPPRARWR